jgi:hypothetical protein
MKTMAGELKPIDIGAIPELARLLAERGEVLLVSSGPQQAIIEDAAPKRRRRRRGVPAGRPMTEDDPLWKLVGSATDAPPTDASKIHEYLADAYAPKTL